MNCRFVLFHFVCFYIHLEQWQMAKSKTNGYSYLNSYTDPCLCRMIPQYVHGTLYEFCAIVSPLMLSRILLRS
ncbi:hypothetical protein KP509_02G018100 [Ceratopteris richardii]|uniref:Secreted protein n=1 Tax=Ceratopteris richardii TaxID=49495 RepID=A0A8T2V7N4_CERRI|nr:hypothetical protein KP509_02G018100 [Ceratopteris richardii]